jgi:AbrB family looped-hinge helix DNA binding protein
VRDNAIQALDREQDVERLAELLRIMELETDRGWPLAAPSATSGRGVQSTRRDGHELFTRLYWYGKGVARISTKNQITIPVAALEEVGLHAGEQVAIEPAGDGELRIRRSTVTFEDAFGALTGTYPGGYLDRLDAEDDQR